MTEQEKFWSFIREVKKQVDARPPWQRGAIDRKSNVYLENYAFSDELEKALKVLRRMKRKLEK